MTRKEIAQAKRRLIEINNIQNSSELMDIPNSEKKVDTGQYKRYEALRNLALEVGGSYISTERQKTANEGELTEGIHRALQTATMIDMCRTAAKNYKIALVAAIAAWAAVLAMVLIAALTG